MAFCSDMTLEEREVFYQKVMDRANLSDTFATASGIRITYVGDRRATGELTVTHDSLNPWGFVHGGCLAALADTVAGTAVFTAGYKCVTLSYSFNFLRPAMGAFIRCAATPQKVGRKVSVMDVTLTNDQGKVVATGNFTFFHTGDVEEKDLEPVKWDGAGGVGTPPRPAKCGPGRFASSPAGSFRSFCSVFYNFYCFSLIFHGIY
mgnify:CR=1 FL=1